MNYLSFILLYGFILMMLGNQHAIAHSGPHASKDCFIQVGSTQLRFNGYQFHSKHPEKLYCHHFPLLGDVIISIDSLQDMSHNEISLQWLEMSSLSQVVGSSEKLFKITHKTPWKAFDKGINSIKQPVHNRGIYALNILLKAENGNIRQQQFYFLVGFPITLILVVIACLLLLLIVVIFFKQWKRTTSDHLTS